MHARLASETDLAGFRAEARTLLAHQVPPEQVHWETVQAQNANLFAEPPSPADSRPRSVPKAATAIVPASFVRLCELVVLHSDPQRFALLYRLLWRLVHEPGLRNDPVDADMLAAQQIAQAVRRDMHKMKALLRFRPLLDETHPGEMLHVAWFEPAHHIVEAVAPWFAKRFADIRWAIHTPERSVRWDLQQLHYGPGTTVGGQAVWSQHPLDSSLPDNPMAHPPSVPRPVRQDAPAITLRSDRIASLEELQAATMRCRECPIGEHATQSVVGEGPLQARLMFVGEQPGDQEDLHGHPFVGPAGQLLERALQQLGLPREQVFVSNAVKHFKFERHGQRRLHKTPTQREAAACLHWLEDEIALVQPLALVALGATAARSLLGRVVSVTAERGHWLMRADGRRVLITLHPSALLRMPPEQRDAAFAAFLADLEHARAVFEP